MPAMNIAPAKRLGPGASVGADRSPRGASVGAVSVPTVMSGRASGPRSSAGAIVGATAGSASPAGTTTTVPNMIEWNTQ